MENRTHNPFVILHRGPGLVQLCHNYLDAKSTHFKEKPSTFTGRTIDLFIDELVNLLSNFNIQDGFDLFGHSWGGILTSEFDVRRQPTSTGLKHLIITSWLAASSLRNQSNGQLMLAFSDNVKQGLTRMGGMKEPEKFIHTLKEFHSVQGCVIRPVSAEWYTLDQVFGPDGYPAVASAP